MCSPEAVSVVVTAYNGEGLVGRCLESLADQSLRPMEIVVVDDGSSDGTVAEIESFQRRFPGLATVWSQVNRGMPDATNRAVRECSGALVAIADQDDVFRRDRLATSVELLLRTGADMVGGQVVGRLGRSVRLATSRFPTDQTAIADRIARGLDPLPHTTMMVRRSGFERFGEYRPNSRAADLELMLRWAHRGARIAVSPEVFAEYRFRREFFSIDVQTRWMLYTRFAREVALLDDDEVPTFDLWFSRQPLGPARREAFLRIARLGARLALGTVARR